MTLPQSLLAGSRSLRANGSANGLAPCFRNLRAVPRRGLASYAQSQPRPPCRDYLDVTHPDNFERSDSAVSSTLKRFEASTLATYSRPTVLLTRGSGLDLYAAAEEPTPSSIDAGAPSPPAAAAPEDVSERHYLDFSSGIAVNSLGHADEQIARIAHEQAMRLVHSSNLYHNEWSGELADRLTQMTRQLGGLGWQKGEKAPLDGSGGLKVFLANSGTEANEAALKFARKHGMVKAGGKSGVKSGLVSFSNAFHGRTMGALAMTPNPKYQAPFAPLIGNVTTGKYNDMSGLEELVNESTAGVIVEPVQGEGGIFPASIEWLRALRRRCDEVGALLIFDEIQCGLYRCGTLWCHSEFPHDAHPDLVTMAKPLANGFPIGAVLMRQKVADAVVVGDHGTTFGGGPLVSRIAHHVLGRLSQPDLVESMRASSERLFERLAALRNHFPQLVRHEVDTAFESPRGRGLLVGLSTREPSHAGKVVKMARERGLIVLTAGSDAIRIVPSLIVTREQVDKAVDILESCFYLLQQEVDAGVAKDSSSKLAALGQLDDKPSPEAPRQSV